MVLAQCFRLHTYTHVLLSERVSALPVYKGQNYKEMELYYETVKEAVTKQ